MNNNLIQSTNEITFEELYRKYYPDLFLYIHCKLNHPKEVAEDIASEAFALLFAKWESFNPKYYPALITWLRKASLFISYDLNRKAQQLPTIPLEDMMDNENITDHLLYHEDIRRLQQNLTPEEYQLFENIVIYNRSIKQIAPTLNVSPGTLKVRWFRLKHKIRQIL